MFTKAEVGCGMSSDPLEDSSEGKGETTAWQDSEGLLTWSQRKPQNPTQVTHCSTGAACAEGTLSIRQENARRLFGPLMTEWWRSTGSPGLWILWAGGRKDSTRDCCFGLHMYVVYVCICCDIIYGGPNPAKGRMNMPAAILSKKEVQKMLCETTGLWSDLGGLWQVWQDRFLPATQINGRFVKVQIGAQLHGVTIIAPCKFRRIHFSLAGFTGCPTLW